MVFVKPPRIERLKETRQSAKMISGKDDKGTAKSFTVREETRRMCNPHTEFLNVISCLESFKVSSVTDGSVFP